MRPARVLRRRSFWLDLFACFLIPAYTLLFAGSVEWFGTNFSVIAVTGKDHYWGFVYWGLIAGGSGLLFLLAGMVSSALEVFFTITAALLTRRIWLTAGERQEKF